jgi:hypothetical protein
MPAYVNRLCSHIGGLRFCFFIAAGQEFLGFTMSVFTGFICSHSFCPAGVANPFLNMAKIQRENAFVKSFEKFFFR